MKKFISAIASAVMFACFSAMPLTAHADYGVTFEAGQVSTTGAVSNGVLEQDEIVKVPINITENQGVTSFLIEFSHDSNIQIINDKVKATESDFVSDTFNGSFMWNLDALRLLWTEMECKDVDVCGLVVNLEVKVPAGTPVGKYEIGFNAPELQVTNSNFDSIEYTLIPGYVEVVGNSAENPPAQTEPAQTEPEKTEPPATQAADTQPVTTTRPPSAQAPANTTKAVETTKAETTAANSVTTNAPANTDKSVTTTTKTDNAVTVTQTDADGNIVTLAVSDTSSDTFSSDTAADSKSSENTDNSDSEKSESKSDTTSKSSSDKKKNSPSTGISSGEIAVIGVVLTVSAAGAVIAFKSRKGKNK